MSPRDFVYWLQGFVEISAYAKEDYLKDGLSKKQLDEIRRHLTIVFNNEASAGAPLRWSFEQPHSRAGKDGEVYHISCSYDGKPKETETFTGYPK